ncbi:MAG: hypothetical protein HUU54_04225 [Ignavibacteriaceae bacterium]|nr:hypothetical protein [Ignavibacteriaceae bacterium]
MKYTKILLTLWLLFLIIPSEVYSQNRITARGTSTFRKVGVHRGNQVRTVFSNYGVIAQPGAQGPRGSWKYDANGYVGDVSPVVGVMLPVRDYRGTTDPDTLHSVVITPVDRPGGGDYGAGGKFRGFEPIPGFANPNLNSVGKGVAMSHQPETWPATWPDYPTWSYSGNPIIVNGVDVTPLVDWNGYFGRAQFNADQESYFWMDDDADDEMYGAYQYYPDMNDTLRRGQALQVKVRGLQWSNFLAQDVVFWLYDIKNDGTQTYDKTVFGTLVGTYVGIDGDEWNDDVSFFDVREAITYTWDFDKYIRPTANPQWLPNPRQVGYIAYAFLESPGNPYDGVDNDGDNQKFAALSAPYFDGNSFNSKTVAAGDKYILIDKNTFTRTPFTMPNDTVTVSSMGVNFFLSPGVTKLVEGDIDPLGNVNANALDGIDNDLDGLIDENYIVHYRQYKKDQTTGLVLIDTINPVQYKNYIASLGLTDPMIDERRDDGIDNDGDWSVLLDDVGADGKAGTNDFGEGDGQPTEGEPNFDSKDVDESDQLGLTSFQYFVPAGDITMSNEEDMWLRLRPGYFQVPKSIVNNVAIKGEDGDFMYGSGYFPLLPGKTERFSLALAFGDDFPAVLKTKRVAQLIYNANYNFPRPPDKPTLRVVAGDKKVTLYWDNAAEKSIDPTLKERDFEGYKIYKGTDPDFTDALQISDGTGQKVFYKPIAQFDLANGIYGYFQTSASLNDLTSGAPFFLGSETGIQNSFIDTDVINGKTYYYAVVAYDRGKTSADVYPSENTRFVAKDALGNISTDNNTAVVVPNAPVAGYVPPVSGEMLNRVSGKSSATPYFEVIDPVRMKESIYIVSMHDSLVNGIKFAYGYDVKDSLKGETLISNAKLTPGNGVVFDGVRLSFDTSYQVSDSIKLTNPFPGGWKYLTAKPDTLKDLRYIVSRVDIPQLSLTGVRDPADFVFVFNDAGTDSSFNLAPLGIPLPVLTNLNFKIFDITDRQNPKRVKFAMVENNAADKGKLSMDDLLFLSNEQFTKLTWRVLFDTSAGQNDYYRPKEGDSLFLSFTKPFTASDKFVLATNPAKYDAVAALRSLENVKAVPNPYVVTNVFESPLPPQIRGRGERIIYFINLPPKSKVSIFTSSGDHVRTIQHDGDIHDGTMEWDLKTKEGLEVAYGVYFYVVELDGSGEKKFGKLAVIK